MYKPILVFSENCEKYKNSVGYKYLMNEGWTIYNIPSQYDAVTAQEFAKAAKETNAEKLGILVENVSDAIIDFVYEDCGTIIDTDLFDNEIFKMTEADVQASPATVPQPGNPATTPTQDRSFEKQEWDSTNKTVGLYLVYNSQHFTDVKNLRADWQSLGPASGANGFFKVIKDENVGKQIDASNTDNGVIAANSRSTNELLSYIGMKIDKDQAGKSEFGFTLNTASSKRETPWINTRILAISPVEKLYQCLPNNIFEDMMNSFNGTPFIVKRSNGNTSVIVDSQTTNPGEYSLSENITAEVSKKRDSIANFIYILDKTSSLLYTPSTKADVYQYNYFMKSTDPIVRADNDLYNVSNYIERTLQKVGFKATPESQLIADNLKFKNIVNKIKQEIASPGYKPKKWHTNASQSAACIQNGVTLFIDNSSWLDDIRQGEKTDNLPSEEEIESKDIDKKKDQLNKKISNKDHGFILNSIRDIGNAFNIKSYKSMASLADEFFDNIYDPNKAELEALEIKAALEGTNIKISKAKDYKLLVNFLGAESFNEFAEYICPELWSRCKNSVYKNTAAEDKESDKQAENQLNNSKDDKQKNDNIKVDNTNKSRPQTVDSSNTPNFFKTTQDKTENKF